MNINVKPKAFQKRKPSPIAAQATASSETFIRFVATKAAGLLGQDEGKFASIKWPADRRLHGVIRASAEPPTDLSNTPALAVMGTDFVESLQPISAAARLFRASRLMLNFDRLGAITVPDLFGIDEGPPAWVESGRPAPVGELTANATILQPFKLEFIVTVTREMILGSNAERLLGDALRAKIAFDLDKTLFDALPEDAARPAGLRSDNARLPESNWTSGNDNAMMQDVGALIAAAESIAGGEDFYFIARSRRIAAMRKLYHGQVPPNMALLPSAASLALPDSVLLCVVPRAVPSAIGLAEVELVESATVEVDDAPGGPDFSTASNVRSFFQSDTLGLKVRLPASWGLRHPAGANWITCLWPADMGASAGGLPDAPADQFHYGRHQGGWEPVIEEAPATPANTGFVRATFGAGHDWYPVADTIPMFARLDSPTFVGTPTAPHPPPGDASTRLATTQFVADNAGQGGGVDEVPAAPNGAYARVRGGANATWVDFVTLGVAPLESPIFTGIPRSTTTPPAGTNSNVLATCDFVTRDFLAFAGGVMTGPFMTQGGNSGSNLGISIGDNTTGFYRPSAGVLIASVGGVASVQFMPTVVAFFVPVNMANNVIQSVGDPANATDALNLRTGDSRYARGGGPIISGPGTGPTDVGVGVGDAATGFYRIVNDLAVSQQGFPLLIFHDTRSMTMTGPLSMSASVIAGLGDATAADHALNRQSGDARYLQQTGGFVTGALQLLFTPAVANDAVTKGYVDALSARAPSVLLEPASVSTPVAPNDRDWVLLWTGGYTVARAGSRILVSVAINVDQTGSGAVCIMGVRIQTGIATYTQRQSFVYKPSNAGSTAGGVFAQFFIDVPGPGTLQNLGVEIALLDASTGAPPLTTIATGDARSQICIVDLGPI